MYDDMNILASMMILCMMMETLHYYATWLIVRGRSAQDARSAPPLLDLTNPQYSPIIAVRQHLAGLMHGLGSRIQVLIRRSGCSSVREFI